MSADLEPIDPKQCQGELLGGSFMTFGPRKYRRCSSLPCWVAIDIQEGEFYGAMSLCDDCKAVCEIREPTARYQRLSLCQNCPDFDDKD